MLIDTHCHLHDRQFFTAEQAEEMLNRARQNGIETIICIGTDPDDSLAARDFARAHENVFWTFGVHPSEWAKNRRVDFADTKLIGIGEVGLDYHCGQDDRAEQIDLFRQMLDFAATYDLPVSFHIREAFPDFFEIIKEYPSVRGVVHSFSDSKKNLKKILETTNFYVGVNGLATYSTLPTPPLNRILLETDAPFLTPTPNRGKINEPAYIKDIAAWLAAKLGVSEAEVAEITTKNAHDLFQFSNPYAISV